MKIIYTSPSFYAHAIAGLLTFIALIILFMSINDIKSIGSYKLIILLLMFSAVIGIHGISHLGLEQTYKYNPLQMNMLERLYNEK